MHVVSEAAQATRGSVRGDASTLVSYKGRQGMVKTALALIMLGTGEAGCIRAHLSHLDKVSELWIACRHEPVDLALKLHLLLVCVRSVVLAQPRLALAVLQQDVLDHSVWLLLVVVWGARVVRASPQRTVQ